MDFYQIWATYNRQWSKFEISVFVGAMTLVCIVIAVCVHKKKFSLIQGGQYWRCCCSLGLCLVQRYLPGRELFVSIN